MIKDKITQEIKQAFIEELKRTRDTGRESGFLLCIDNGELKIPKRCQGSQCRFAITDLKKYCPDKIQGCFHTHPYYSHVKEFYKRDPRKGELGDAKRMYEKNFARSGLNLQTPSHHDVVDTLQSYCTGNIEGTVCVGNDLDMEKVECWTVIGDKVKFRDCSQATKDTRERISDAPKKWVKDLFYKEIINLRND